MDEQRERFEALLPFYQNGTLTPEEQAWVQAYLRDQPAVAASMQFAQHLQATVRDVVEPNLQPTAVQVQRMLQRVDQARLAAAPRVTRWWHEWVVGFAGMGMAATAVVLILTVSPLSLGVLHMDELDGRPDLELVLAPGVSPDHETVVAQLQKHEGVIVGHTQVDGHYRLAVDLPRRSGRQHALVQDMQASGHLHDYTLLASQ